MTTVSYAVEGSEFRSGIVSKQPSYASLADIKLELGLPQEGVYLVKTPDPEGHHWSVIANDQDVLPCFTEGSIVLKIKPTFQGMK